MKEKIIHQFYRAFARKDYRTMAACYHPKVTFQDSVFEIKEKEVTAMWHMLCERGKDLEVSHSDVEVFGNVASANWVAKYTFLSTGRRVVNEVAASFIFKDGLIVTHTDDFDFHRWSTQALGLPGLFLGWSDFLKNKVRKQAADSLNAFISTHSEYQKK